MRPFVLFLVLLVGFDQALGAVLDRLYRRTTSGELGGLINYALTQNPEVLVLGSSRARHHVSSSILQARLSAPVFNAGVNGQDFLYAVMLLDLWVRSHRPPMAIVLHVDPQSLERSEEEIQRTSVFSAYFGDSQTVRRILLMRGNYARLKYLSYSYRFNGKVFPIVKNLFVRPDPTFDGYIGLAGALDAGADGPAGRGGPETGALPYWDVKLEYLNEISQYCRNSGTRLFLFTSPVFKPDPGRQVWSARLSRLVASYPGVEFLDLSERTHPELFAGKPQLFKDNNHLNARGAEMFSALLGDQLAARIGETKAWRAGGTAAPHSLSIGQNRERRSVAGAR
jgi:hypothetical protein